MRDYQQEMLERLYVAWERHQSVMVQMPTGTGKTYLMAAVIRENMEQGVVIVAHRVELIGQISQTLDEFGVAHGIVDRTTVDVERTIRENRVVVASIQTLARRMGQTEKTEKTDRQIDNRQIDRTGPGLVIVDEAHHAVAKSYRWMWEKWPEARFLGLTATPCRLNMTGFTDLFDRLLESYPIQEFIDRGWLSDFEYVSVTPDNWMVERIAGLKKRGADGDYQTKEMATVMDTQESIEHLYQSYVRYVKGKKGIVYAISREHAQHISEYYMDHGVKCCWIEAQTPAEERQRLVDAYRKGEMDVIVNVDIFSEGFNCPEVEFIQLARPTLSLSKYLQQLGRGMRVVKGKEYVVILDQVGMYQTFGLPTEDRNWELMFRGKESGRGQHGADRGYVIRDEGKDLRLLNLEMVRIKRHGEQNRGMELFIKGGKYGVLNDGKVVCAPEFEKVRRLEAPYFVMGVYPFYVYHGRVTVIDKEGRDLRAALYGNVRQEGDVFTGKNVQGKTVYWDAKGGRSYAERPQFSRLLRFEVAKSGQQLFLRYGMKGWEQAFSLNHVFVGKSMTIMGNVLFYHNNQNQPYRVCGYKNGLVFVECREKPGYTYAYIMRSGNIEGYVRNLPKGLDEWPDISELGLKRMS